MSKIIIALYVLTTSLALIVLKLGTRATAGGHHLFDKLPFNVNLYTILGIFLYGVSFLVYVYLISKYDLGYIIPLGTAFVYIVIFAASFFIFNEVFTVIKVIGISFIVVGLILLNLKK
jgi:drug/metabolite transporter (DMT)-like permease